MKTLGMKFGISAVKSGQKSAIVNAEPQLIANSTLGKFLITAPVSKTLNIAVGENIMFFNNIAEVENAVQLRSEEVLAAAAELGVDLNTRDGQEAFIKHFTEWYIAKGYVKYDKSGVPMMTTERFTKEDRLAYLEAHRSELVAKNREVLVEQFGEMSDEELAAKITIDMIELPKVLAYEGSKTAATSSATGVGLQLNFTDTTVWNTLKADLGEEATKMNRVFDVNLKEITEVEVFNGYNTIKVVVAPIVFNKDVRPIVRSKKEVAE